jgi:hypothetical protein
MNPIGLLILMLLLTLAVGPVVKAVNAPFWIWLNYGHYNFPDNAITI